jgi:hypothetical protein
MRMPSCIRITSWFVAIGTTLVACKPHQANLPGVISRQYVGISGPNIEFNPVRAEARHSVAGAKLTLYDLISGPIHGVFSVSFFPSAVGWRRGWQQ